MNLEIEKYIEQVEHWPTAGRHIMGQHDDETIIVYQAYRPAIAEFAIGNQRFGGEFRYSRMSWIKPNFLWMMYRSGWATKKDQERVLAIRLTRSFFETLLEQATSSTYDSSQYESRAEWRQAIASSSVRLQWDPDHDPAGQPLARRAVQIGIRGEMLIEYATQSIVEIEDISGFVHEQRKSLERNGIGHLQVPVEREFVPSDKAAIEKLGISLSPDLREHASVESPSEVAT